jgi:hypothetical protein
LLIGAGQSFCQSLKRVQVIARRILADLIGLDCARFGLEVNRSKRQRELSELTGMDFNLAATQIVGVTTGRDESEPNATVH